MSRVKKVFAVACSSVMLAGVAASPAAAANKNQQDGLVNVAITGDCTVVSCITLSDVNVGVAVNAVVSACNLKVGPVNVIARQVDRSGTSQSGDCGDDNTFTFSQN